MVSIPMAFLESLFYIYHLSYLNNYWLVIHEKDSLVSRGDGPFSLFLGLFISLNNREIDMGGGPFSELALYCDSAAVGVYNPVYH